MLFDSSKSVQPFLRFNCVGVSHHVHEYLPEMINCIRIGEQIFRSPSFVARQRPDPILARRRALQQFHPNDASTQKSMGRIWSHLHRSSQASRAFRGGEAVLEAANEVSSSSRTGPSFSAFPPSRNKSPSLGRQWLMPLHSKRTAEALRSSKAPCFRPIFLLC